MNRRDVFRLAGGAIWIAGCAHAPAMSSRNRDGFLIIQITDTHWGYHGPANPAPEAAIEHALAEIAAWPERPAFVVHTGDITQLTPDAAERKRRLTAAQRAFAGLGVPLHCLPGEHDASLDRGAGFEDVFGATHWAFSHDGVHAIGLDNSSGKLGEAQLAWFADQLRAVPAGAPLLVFAHRPLFPLAQAWDWFTADGDRALALLEQHPGATVFYGHIHQANLAKTGPTTHVAARALVFPLPAPMSMPEKAPVPWDAAAIDHGLGYRAVALERGKPLWMDRALVG